jgi:hypothetical protein
MSDAPLPADPDAALRDLVHRLLAPPYPGLPDAERLQLLVGQLPADVRDELPLPHGIRVVGTLVRGSWDAEVVLDAAVPAERALAALRRCLKAAGWRRRRFPQPAVFRHGFQATDCTAYYRSPRGTALHLLIRGRPSRPTDVRLMLAYHQQWRDLRPKNGNAGASSAAAEAEARARLLGARFDSPIPPLSPPPAVLDLFSCGVSTNANGECVSTAVLTAELGSHALAAHYGLQLQQAGWHRLREDWGGAAAWSTWSLSNPQGRKWGGVLLVAELPGAADKRLLYLRVDPMA